MFLESRIIHKGREGERYRTERAKHDSPGWILISVSSSVRRFVKKIPTIDDE